MQAFIPWLVITKLDARISSLYTLNGFEQTAETNDLEDLISDPGD